MQMPWMMKRIAYWTVGVGMVAIVTIGCGGDRATEETVEVTESETPTTETVTETPEETSRTETKDVEKPDLKAIFGTAEEGWLPTILTEAKLTSTMTPEQVGAIFPGAEAVSGPEESDFRFSEAPTQDTPGIQSYQFSFQNNQLYSVSIIFEPELSSEEFFQELTEITVAKYGEVEPEDLEDKQLIWVAPNFESATLTEGLSESEGYEFNIVLPDE